MVHGTFSHDHYSTTQGINAVYKASLTHAVLLSVQILSVLKGKVRLSGINPQWQVHL